MPAALTKRRERQNGALAENELFRRCDPRTLHYTACRFRRGESVPDSLNGLPCVGVVSEGSVEVYSVAGDGGELNVKTLVRGDMFGICNIFARSPLPTALRAGARCEVLYIAKDEFARQLTGSPELFLEYAALLNEKIQFLSLKLELGAASTCRGRLACYLLQAAQGDTVRLTGSKQQLASRLGVSRASLFRELAALERQGAIAVRGAEITILNRGALEPDGSPTHLV
ncbi:Crp/Fnr family transcriptional regulator [Feifania hominis]|uniref:Crp/Fnr family transcriptional regulator n=1 Tax=Feifania hominis TaxID=2763660 RepID=A0A926HV51_9FIRM|nr:Crp/Fnr family transcriptional regulator [Feifania hominis]MBC8536630.1 Crp/Fnr family transcriptional regulator [Feifania hominis]